MNSYRWLNKWASSAIKNHGFEPVSKMKVRSRPTPLEHVVNTCWRYSVSKTVWELRGQRWYIVKIKWTHLFWPRPESEGYPKHFDSWKHGFTCPRLSIPSYGGLVENEHLRYRQFTCLVHRGASEENGWKLRMTPIFGLTRDIDALNHNFNERPWDIWWLALLQLDQCTPAPSGRWCPSHGLVLAPGVACNMYIVYAVLYRRLFVYH